MNIIVLYYALSTAIPACQCNNNGDKFFIKDQPSQDQCSGKSLYLFRYWDCTLI